MILKNQFQRVKEIETKINRNLFVICSVVTIVVMAMVLSQFFTRGAFPPTQITLFYLGVLILYSLHKEIVRWLGQRKIERQGEYFVYSWIILTTLLFAINFFTKGYFSYSAEGEHLNTLREISTLTLEVFVIFIFTRVMKMLKICLVKRQLLKKIKGSD